jgi:hypothetical protein
MNPLACERPHRNGPACSTPSRPIGLAGPSVVEIDQRTDDRLAHIGPGVSVMVMVGGMAPPAG